MWLREKESNLHSLRSKRSVLPVTPSRNENRTSVVGALGFEPRTLRLSGANTVYKAAALPLSYAPENSFGFRVLSYEFAVPIVDCELETRNSELET